MKRHRKCEKISAFRKITPKRSLCPRVLHEVVDNFLDEHILGEEPDRSLKSPPEILGRTKGTLRELVRINRDSRRPHLLVNAVVSEGDERFQLVVESRRITSIHRRESCVPS